ncbi:class I SAM-dependent methyltransferase [Paenibacillus paridis]|uniref:class I SAM-dependent methyltransferase n=1 Tax=Paenibacillus paridis TaxID=2583376 RepID=UPI001391C25C|nr:SAM-dependent methyltransferase [Paenibacillus paridis]
MMKENALAAALTIKISASPLSGWHINTAGSHRTVPCITFRDFMEACLYDAQLGYYRSGPVRVGKEGDFYTSSAIGNVLAQVLAKFALDYAQEIGEPLGFVEWGAGTGRLSAQIAEAGCKQSIVWGHKFHSILIEDHPGHQREAMQMFLEIGNRFGVHMQMLSSEEGWKSELLQKPALILANELLDAFPVHRIQKINGQLLEIGVAHSVEMGFYEVYMPVTDDRIEGWLIRDGMELSEGQQTEIHADASSFLKKLGTVVKRGRLVLIDYGHESAEYAAKHRMMGTLMCYYRHQAGGSPYSRIGEQDITSHVPFTFIKHEAEESGWQVSSYATQKQFLIEHGVLELLQNHNSFDPFSEAARANRAIRQLLLSDQMSESFKVMVLDKK